MEFQTKLELLLLVVFILCLIALSVILFKILSGSGYCVLDPLSYYAKENNITNACEHCWRAFNP